jgi:hypothetical protein
MTDMKTEWKEESVSDFMASADTDKSFNSKPSKDLPLWKKDEKSGESSKSKSSSKFQDKADIVVAKRENKK